MVKLLIHIIIIILLVSCNAVSPADIPPQCPSPVEIFAPQEGQNSIILSWEASFQAADEYLIERSLNELSGYEDIALIDSQLNSYADTDVIIDTAYYYRIIASNECGNSEPSNIVSLSVEPPTPGGSGVLNFSDITSDSTNLSWTQAVDNVSGQNDLEYKVIYSLHENDVNTLENAIENGILAIDWTNNIVSLEIGGLISVTTYYFNVLVRDEAGNISLYEVNAVIPSDGIFNMSVSVVQPEDESISFSAENDFTVNVDSTMTIHIPDLYESYQWYLDGVLMDGENTYIFTLDCSEIAPGVHHLAAFVIHNSMLYSDTIRFTVTN